MKQRQIAALGASALLGWTAQSQAATISWGSATNITGTSDVSTAGTSLYAARYYGSTGVPLTLNGVTFTDPGSNITWGGPTQTLGTNTGSITGDYKTFLQGNSYASSSNSSSGTLTLNSLASGIEYQVQVWANDGRIGAFGQAVDFTAGNTVSLNRNTIGAGGLGQWATGTFTADAATQAITVSNSLNQFLALNGVQVRILRADLGDGGVDSNGTLDLTLIGTQTALTTAKSFKSVNFTGAIGATMTGSGALTASNGIITYNSTGTITGGTLAGSASGGLILDTDQALSLDSTAIINNGGATTLTKTGAASLSLGAVNTYTGATSVNEGTLKITGSIGDSVVTVNNSGTVLASGSTGTIGKGVTVTNGAILAAGGQNTVGTATVGSDGLSFASGSIFDWDLTTGSGNGTYDTVSVTGSLAITSGAKFNVVSSTAFTDTFWNASHTWSDIFGGKTIDNFLVSNFLYSGSATAPSTEGFFSISGSSLTWTAVPEPTSALAGLLITAGLLRRRR